MRSRGANVTDWVCCGVPMLNTVRLGVPAAGVRVQRDGDAWMVQEGVQLARRADSSHAEGTRGHCVSNGGTRRILELDDVLLYILLLLSCCTCVFALGFDPIILVLTSDCGAIRAWTHCRA